ncbi:ParB/RepB/Spo0J family partition protein [Streptacidiphilus monticola]|uniref:ParB/RepB/Spo0J family partition protein n=1 Tax=Streptacidiphilus monticola TaxID=2161674 RepID=A0ABW1FZM4_9ACTN
MSERRRGLGRGLGALIPAASGPAVVPGNGSAVSPTGAPGLGSERGVAAVKVAGIGSVAPVQTLEREDQQGSDAVSRETAGRFGTEELSPVAGAYFAELPLDTITPNPRQPREIFDEEALAELVHSIKEVGLLQPVVVRQLGPERYELIMGERRWRASREAGLEKIPAIVRATEDEKLLLDALLENLHRAQLNPLEEAAAYDQLLKDFACTHEQLADRIGRSRSQVSNTLRLLRLSPPVQRRVAAGVLSAGHARALLGLGDTEEQDRLAERIVAEGLSVRTVEEIVALAGMDSAGQGEKKARGPRAGRRVSPAFASLASRLSDRFDTRVKVELGQKRGKIVVEFASVEDLDRILGSFAPGEGALLRQGLEGDSEED